MEGKGGAPQAAPALSAGARARALPSERKKKRRPPSLLILTFSSLALALPRPPPQIIMTSMSDWGPDSNRCTQMVDRAAQVREREREKGRGGERPFPALLSHTTPSAALLLPPTDPPIPNRSARPASCLCPPSTLWTRRAGPTTPARPGSATGATGGTRAGGARPRRPTRRAPSGRAWPNASSMRWPGG